MSQNLIIDELRRNKAVFESLLSGTSSEQHLWKPAPEKWCLLEVVCHLFDEEREDFRARVKHCLDDPNSPLPSIDPVGWVLERNYIGQDFDKMVARFLGERENSIKWLKSLERINWESGHDHPKLGKMTASLYLSNWLAHDYIHVRQILKIRYAYLDELTNESLAYAGNW